MVLAKVKRSFFAILCLLAMTCSIFSFDFSVYAEEKGIIELSSNTTQLVVNQNSTADSFIVEVKITKNPGINGIGLIIPDYLSNDFDIKVENGDIFTGMKLLGSTNVWGWEDIASGKNYFDTGVILKLTMTPKQMSKTEEYSIGLLVSKDDTFDQYAADVLFDVVPCKVMIIQSTDVKSIAATGTIYYDGSTYKAGPDFKVTATLYDDTIKELSTPDYRISGDGEIATITYNGTDYVGDTAPSTTITTTAKAATSISLNPATVSATVGDSKKTVASKVKYTATYNDGTTSEKKQVTADMLGDLDLSSAGQKTVTVTAEGQTAELTVDVAEHTHTPGTVQGVNKDPTCTEPGSMQYWVCSICQQKFSDEACTQPIETEIIPALGHQLVKHDEVAATCTTTGTKEYWECTRDDCGKLFSDAEGLNEIVAPETIEALGHSLKEHSEVPATCDTAGTKAYWECTRDDCGKLFSDAEGLDEIDAPESMEALGHKMTYHDAVASTCQTHGTIEYWSCDRCQNNFKDNQGLEIADSLEAPLAAHKLSPTEAKDPTATEDGNIAYWTCSVCDKKFSDENCTTEVTVVTIPALGGQVEEIIKDKVRLTTEAVTQEQAVAQIVAQVKEALKNDDYDVTVAVSSFVAPVAGTAENPEGTAGQIVYMVTITNLVNAEDTTTTKEQTLAIAAKEYVAPTAPTYTITVNGAYVDKNTAKEGETVTVTAPYRYGYTFIGWKTSANLTLANRSPVSFKMPAGNVTIEPVYTYNPIYYPPVDYDPPVISKPVTKPEKVEDGWHGDQYYQDGEPVVGWLEVTHGTWYYFDRSGSMVTGWEKVNGTWYYMLDSGVMATGWVKVDGSWYFLKSSGAMATGWLWDNGHWYYLSGSGAMKTGWVLSGSKWYYLNAGGAMVTGWVEWKGDWYYMNTPNGDMAVDTKTPDGYYVNSDGIWVK